jgi:type I restriction enzyme S subunit
MEKLQPSLRFPEFKGDWEESILGNSVSIKSEKHNPSRDKTSYKCIELEHIDTESGTLLGFSDSLNLGSIKNKFDKGDVLFGKLRPYLRKYLLAPFNGVSSSEIWVMKGINISNEFLYRFIQTDTFIEMSNQSTGSKMPRADWSFLKNVSIKFPSLPEQQKIASFLTAVDDKLALLKEKKNKLEQYKKGVMQKIFAQELRFKDDEGSEYPEWEERKLGDVLREHKIKSSGNEEVYSVSVHKGLINQVEHLGRVFAASNTYNYNLVQPSDIVYTKSPTGDFPFGIIKQSKLDKNVIVSPLYGVFTPETAGLGYLLNVYFESSINVSNYLSSIIQKGAKNTINITNNTFLSKKMTLPLSMEEQNKIGDFLSVIDEKIEVVNQQIKNTEEYKKGLLQGMFC